jgi:4-hydroxybenzoate polyprenyltransferase
MSPEVCELATELRQSTSPPLFVDMDGTLVGTDTFAESLILLLKSGPKRMVRSIPHALKGRAHFKNYLADQVALDVTHLPINQQLLLYLQAENAAGREVFLATGANQKIADKVSARLKIFADVLASDERVNLVGRTKLQAIQRKTGGASFSYAGNSKADIPNWRKSAGSVAVDAPAGCMLDMQKAGIPVEAIFATPNGTLADFLTALRPAHWIKNLLVLVPIALAHRYNDKIVLLSGLQAALCFCFCASAVYVLNDVLDLHEDRKNAYKKHRPLASGRMSIFSALLTAVVLVLLSLGLSLFLPHMVTWILGSYLAINLLYSLGLKRYLFVDVVILASFYTARLFSGGAATGIPISIWTLGFSLFLFLSLALVKRQSELRTSQLTEFDRVGGRGYIVHDMQQIGSFGSASSYAAVLVLALYLNSPEVAHHYRHPNVLWAICPLMIYWTSRIWLLASRGWITCDPIVFALRDRASLAVALAAIAVLAIAI